MIAGETDREITMDITTQTITEFTDRTATTATADVAALKVRQQAAWSSGDYAVVGTTLQIVGEQLCEALDLRSGQKVLDVAAGNGNASLAAARRPPLVRRGRHRLRAGAARTGTRTRPGRPARYRIPPGRRRSPAVPRC